MQIPHIDRAQEGYSRYWNKYTLWEHSNGLKYHTYETLPAELSEMAIDFWRNINGKNKEQ